MRTALRRYGPGAALCLLGAVLLLAGTGASLGYLASREEAPLAAAEAKDERVDKGLEVNVGLDLDAPLVDLDAVSLDWQPPAAAGVPLPGLSVDRDLSLDQAGLGCGRASEVVEGASQPRRVLCSDIGLDASLDLAAGSHRAKSQGEPTTLTAASTRAVLAPAVAPALVAVTAFTLAGLAAYFWGGVKAWGAKHLVLPLIGLYAKISRAEVFDNTVRERIFGAIRANPGLSASDLSRAVDVSWGTTIYHLDVLEQTRMVTSIRKGRYRRYFENGAPLTATKDAVAVLRNPVTAGIVEALRARPGVTQKDLAGATNMSPQALHWHLARLVETGLVRKEREGRVVRHFVSA